MDHHHHHPPADAQPPPSLSVPKAVWPPAVPPGLAPHQHPTQQRPRPNQNHQHQAFHEAQASGTHANTGFVLDSSGWYVPVQHNIASPSAASAVVSPALAFDPSLSRGPASSLPPMTNPWHSHAVPLSASGPHGGPSSFPQTYAAAAASAVPQPSLLAPPPSLQPLVPPPPLQPLVPPPPGLTKQSGFSSQRLNYGQRTHAPLPPHASLQMPPVRVQLPQRHEQRQQSVSYLHPLQPQQQSWQQSNPKPAQATDLYTHPQPHVTHQFTQPAIVSHAVDGYAVQPHLAPEARAKPGLVNRAPVSAAGSSTGFHAPHVCSPPGIDGAAPGLSARIRYPSNISANATADGILSPSAHTSLSPSSATSMSVPTPQLVPPHTHEIQVQANTPTWDSPEAGAGTHLYGYLYPNTHSGYLSQDQQQHHPHQPHDSQHHPPQEPYLNLRVHLGDQGADTQQQPHLELHDWWKGKLAPFPGYCSPPGLLEPSLLSLEDEEENVQEIKDNMPFTANDVAYTVKGNNPMHRNNGGAASKQVHVRSRSKSTKSVSVVDPAAGQKIVPQLLPPPSSGLTTGGGNIDFHEGFTSNSSASPFSVSSPMTNDEKHIKSIPSSQNDNVPSGNDQVTQIPEPFKLDKYADPFVPQYLQDIQARPHTLYPLPPLPVFPSPTYSRSFLLPHILEELSSPHNQPKTHLLTERPPPSSQAILPLTADTCHGHWAALLAWELDSLVREKQRIVMWHTGVKLLDWDAATFTLFVPGVRESYPRLEVGDLVVLREVGRRGEEEGVISGVGADANGGKGKEGGPDEGMKQRVAVKGWSGFAFEARVVLIRRREGYVHLSSVAMKQYIQTYLSPPSAQTSYAWQHPSIYHQHQQQQAPLPLLPAKPEDVVSSLSFNISFLVNAWPLHAMDVAAATIGRMLKKSGTGEGAHGTTDEPGKNEKPSLLAESTGDAHANGEGSNRARVDGTATGWSSGALRESKARSVTRCWLFPDEEDLSHPFDVLAVNKQFEDDQWVDKGLNEEQRLAVSSVALHYSPVPYLIGGPPGTGKTRTVVEAVLQILNVQPEATILLCAPSNPATDTLALRLRPHLLPDKMLRLNDQNRTFAEVPLPIMQYCYIEHDKFALPPWKTLMKYRVVVCSCMDANILVSARCTNTVLMRLEEEIIGGLHPYGDVRERKDVAPHWTHLLIDEAAQGSEPELLIPISVVVTDVASRSIFGSDCVDMPRVHIPAPQLVLCGDPHQLGPIVTSAKARSAELDMSLLERLFERAVYVRHSRATLMLLGRKTKKNMAVRTAKSLLLDTARRAEGNKESQAQLLLQLEEDNVYVPVTHLVKNYRSHPAILMPPSALFYNDSLEPCAKNGAVLWSGLPNPQLPLLFVGHEYVENCLDEKVTWFNDGEVERIVDIVKSMLAEKKSTPELLPEHIGIMAPWREQVKKLRERLRQEKLRAVDVGNVEDYQGRESRVVIISCVRSNPRFLPEDKIKGLGLVYEKKRMNVAITRAKELLIVVGNGALLQRDPYWKGFLQFALRNKLYTGPKLEIEMDGNYISRLESTVGNAMELGEEEQGVMIAGGVAREVLKESFDG